MKSVIVKSFAKPVIVAAIKQHNNEIIAQLKKKLHENRFTELEQAYNILQSKLEAISKEHHDERPYN